MPPTSDREAWEFLNPVSEARSLFKMLDHSDHTADSLRQLIAVSASDERELRRFARECPELAERIENALGFRAEVLREFDRLLQPKEAQGLGKRCPKDLKPMRGMFYAYEVGSSASDKSGRMAMEALNSSADQDRQMHSLQQGSLEEICGSAGKSIQLESATRLISSAFRSQTCRRWLLYVLQREFRTFLSRMRYALGSQAYEGPVAGPAFEEAERNSWIVCQRTLARIQDTQQIPQVWQRWDVSLTCLFA
jgi:hypothetical protein